MKTLNELSDFLIQERKSRQLSQKDMRMLIGMSQQQYQRVESGQDLKVSTLLRILSGLSMELTVVDPAANQKDTTTSLPPDTESIWASKHKHLED
ncbi:helix-turn-helix transcriptional regulator [Psychrosphaera sp. 1_MG-2023]|uniref:helix-turn-helix domain-containing protein n=1 Tax=Psychrosphaera sp. 1_MG-2023 TaxID=3062643 RepID=UPI0026E2B928|nr:helix-turn-helix transcriptional regulator [Psychrosphaera sp. 1_MG-2023]MDO6718679.1 helix-turn-helix transcriptional regulator [Psychrosphaera sp. 1_MG-2023]